MKIIDLLNSKKPTLSFEVFPPKTAENFSSVEKAAREIADFDPDFMSVTYGAGGGTSRYTVDIASELMKDKNVTTIAHLTCVSSTKEKVRSVIDDIMANGIENVLALRGDIPKDGVIENDYRYASELIKEIRANAPSLCIGAACYPEGHVESKNRTEDMLHLEEKINAGVDFLTTQMFFDNDILYNFLYRLRNRGITTPVIAGIMPITRVQQVERTFAMSNTPVPERFKAILDAFGDRPSAFEQAGILYATGQIVDLIANGIDGIHIYTMNRPAVAKQIRESLSEIL